MSDDADLPEWTKEGLLAHDIAARCLREGLDPYMYDDCPEEFYDPIQVYVDYARAVPGDVQEIEVHVSDDDLEGVYGTIDLVTFDWPNKTIEIDDLKFGVGVAVDVEENDQLLYYMNAKLSQARLDPDWKVRLGIIQPRGFHPDGPIRVWETTVARVHQWREEELKPALERIYTEAYLTPGEHCRFCPAKLACPAFLGVGREAISHSVDELAQMSPQILSDLLAKAPLMRMMATALEKEAYRRIAIEGGEVEGWKLVQKKGDRVWGENTPLDKIPLQPAKPLSPAMAEKWNKRFVAEWAIKPDAGYIVVPTTDTRKAVKPARPLDNFDPSKYDVGNDD